jgi:hypothetical protein
LATFSHLLTNTISFYPVAPSTFQTSFSALRLVFLLYQECQQFIFPSTNFEFKNLGIDTIGHGLRFVHNVENSSHGPFTVNSCLGSKNVWTIQKLAGGRHDSF